MADNTAKKKITVSEKKPDGKPTKKPVSAKKPDQTVKVKPKNVKNEKMIHQFLPFLWFALALFLALCFFPYDFGLKGDKNIMGAFGEFMHMAPFGILGLASYLLVPLCVYYGIKWRRLVGADTKVKGGKEYEPTLLKKTIYCVVIILLTSVLCHVISMAAGKNPDAKLGGLWENGNLLIGGGVIGGLLGWCFYQLLSAVGSIIVIAVALIVIVLLFADITPHTVAVTIKARRQLKAEQRAALEAERAMNRVEEEEEEPEEEEAPAFSSEPKKKKKLIVFKRREKPENDDGEIFNDGMFEDDPIKDAVMVDKKATEAAEGKAEEPEVTEPEPAEEVFTEPEKPAEPVNLADIFKGTQADDGDDAEMTPSGVSSPLESGALSTEPEEEAPEPAADPAKRPWTPPTVDLLIPDTEKKSDNKDAQEAMKHRIFSILAEYDIRVKDIGCSVGPSITRYEVYPEAGVRVRSISNLAEDIQMRLSAGNIRIAPIDDKPAIGIEVANATRSTVHMRTLIDTDKFRDAPSLMVGLGQDVAGNNIYFDIKKMPHIIIAGTTGSGKSVCINGIICSILYKNSPDKVKLILIDPKKVEFSMYKQIPHLLCPVITEATKAAGALASAVAEMERRYTLIEDVGVRDVDSYNTITAKDPERKYLPKIVIVIDELADLMMMAKNDVEQFITRIAQKARAVGIHLVIGTQRPSVDVITGLIKANVPSRIACTVKSQVDSRTILDFAGAEKLIGYGDMLFSPIGVPKPIRVQGAFLDDKEVEAVVNFIVDNNEPGVFDEEFVQNMDIAAESIGDKKSSGGSIDMSDMAGGGDGEDAKFRQAVDIAIREGKISTSLLQRKLEVGYGRAAKLIDRMEEMGYVSEADGNKPRRILITKQEFYEKVVNGDSATPPDAE